MPIDIPLFRGNADLTKESGLRSVQFAILTVMVRSKSVGALTLLELLVSQFVLVVALLALMLLFGKGLQLNTQSEELTRASEIGREFLESVRAQGGYQAITPDSHFDGRAGDSADPTTGFPPSPYPLVTIENRTYHLVVSTAQQSPRLRAVRVEVWWDEDSRATMETAFSL